MSTRAVYTFIDTSGRYHVYKHHDGYPTGAADFIARAKSNAWSLPRFEADEFGAAFIVANKGDSGGVHLTKSYKAHGDLDFRYEITCLNGALHVKAFDVGYEAPNYERQTAKLIYSGTLEGFTEWARRELHIRINQSRS